MTEATLTAELREAKGKGAARRLRREGRIPAVLYGPGRETKAVAVVARDFFRVYQQVGKHGLVQLQISNGDGGSQPVLIKEVQISPTEGDYVHVDFHAVALDREIDTTVPVALQGEELRKDRSVVQLVLHQLAVRCLPADIPDAIVVDVAQLAVGDVVTVGQLQLPPRVTVMNDPDEVVVTVTPPDREEPAAEAAADGEGGES